MWKETISLVLVLIGEFEANAKTSNIDEQILNPPGQVAPSAPSTSLSSDCQSVASELTALHQAQKTLFENSLKSELTISESLGAAYVKLSQRGGNLQSAELKSVDRMSEAVYRHHQKESAVIAKYLATSAELISRTQACLKKASNLAGL